MTTLTDVNSTLARLIAFDTTSRNSNLALIDDVADLLESHGARTRRVFNDDGSKANLLASIGPDVPGGVVLSGHTDVVPVDDQDWATDPFALTEKDGRLYGRGTADMKTFIAIALSLLPEMAAADLKVPIHFALTYDEEVGCKGVPGLIEALIADLPRPSAVIVGEPTSMQTVTAHKGICSVRTRVTGVPVHSSLTHMGASAVMIAARLIDWLAARHETNQQEAPADSPFSPPATSITVNMIDGGTAVNIMAGHCDFAWDIRSVPGDDPQAHVGAFDAFCRDEVLPAYGDLPVQIDTHIDHIAPPLMAEDAGAAEQLVRALTGDNANHAVAYAAEAGSFQQAGLSTVICGPGSIEQAHQPNEFIEITQVQAGLDFQRRLLGYLSR